MLRKSFIGITVATLIIVLGYWEMSSGAKECSTQTGIPAEKVADYLHAVIQADRTFYTDHVVERMQTKGVVVASENWQESKTLPLPAQFLNESSRLAGATQAGIAYRLISLWPINKRNGPKTEFELKGLSETLQNPNRPYTEVVMHGGDAYLQAIYADKAITQACIGCHNAHQDSPRQDFKQNDVMGGILITVPLNR